MSQLFDVTLTAVILGSDTALADVEGVAGPGDAEGFTVGSRCDLSRGSVGRPAMRLLSDVLRMPRPVLSGALHCHRARALVIRSQGAEGAGVLVRRGMVSTKVAPWPGPADDAVTSPPCARAMLRAMVSPIPEPLAAAQTDRQPVHRLIESERLRGCRPPGWRHADHPVLASLVLATRPALLGVGDPMLHNREPEQGVACLPKPRPQPVQGTGTQASSVGRARTGGSGIRPRPWWRW